MTQGLSIISKKKEADKVDVPPLPTAPQFYDWKSKVAENSTAAAGTGNEAFVYILDKVSIEAKLSVALQKVLTGTLRQEVQRVCDQQRVLKRLVGGRWKLWIIHKYFQRDQDLVAMHAYNDLSTIKYNRNRGYTHFSGLRSCPSADQTWSAG